MAHFRTFVYQASMCYSNLQTLTFVNWCICSAALRLETKNMALSSLLSQAPSSTGTGNTALDLWRMYASYWKLIYTRVHQLGASCTQRKLCLKIIVYSFTYFLFFFVYMCASIIGQKSLLRAIALEFIISIER